MNPDDKSLIERIAVSMTKGITAEIVRKMEEEEIPLTDFFTMPAIDLSNALGLSKSHTIHKAARNDAYSKAWKELEFIKQHNIRTLFLSDDEYPERLRECYNAPVMLYQLGDCDLNSEHILSVVGTRKATPYGADFCHTTIKELGELLSRQLTVVSGLAYGIDALAHNACLEFGIPTIGVLAHGLDMIYPAAHRDLARRIVKSGGALLTEYPSSSKPFQGHFLERNRVVAGISDGTIVVESDIKGGAMSTAQYAFNYDRVLMSLPGRSSDAMSRGCNHLIRKNKAALVTSTADVAELMDWIPKEFRVTPRQRILFPELSDEEQQVYDLLRFSKDDLTIDEIHTQLKTPMHQLQATLMEMEFNGIITRIPGNKVSLTS